jgi:hypothetical protein
MHVLFIHRNFPAQFRYIAPRLAARHGWTYSYATARTDDHAGPGGTKVVYRPVPPPPGAIGRCAGPSEEAAGHARGVYEALKHRPDVTPDLVVAHSGDESKGISTYKREVKGNSLPSPLILPGARWGRG